jgi:branched-subunit amino acid transport protein
MYYYISTFNFAIYYGFALIFAIAAALWIERRASESLESSTPYPRNWRRWLKILGPITIAFATVAASAFEAHRFRSPSPNQDQQRLFATTIERALKMDSIQPKLLRFEGQAWGEAAGVALYLRRAGCSWYVADYAPSIPLIFGRDRAIPDKETDARVPNASIWRIVSPRSASFLLREGFTVLPLAWDVELVIKPDPRNGAQVGK